MFIEFVVFLLFLFDVGDYITGKSLCWGILFNYFILDLDNRSIFSDLFFNF